MGVLFGNILMRTPEDASADKLVGLQNTVIEIMVRNLDKLFIRTCEYVSLHNLEMIWISTVMLYI